LYICFDKKEFKKMKTGELLYLQTEEQLALVEDDYKK